ncbi:MAG: guanylate kinase [Pseudobutyrivibrio sp.]|uniref:guanylate kinase n=1 Tax=Pseudobutyrivibrio sp. TaxID=2014367 RepID=UPI001B634A53|nr:guanylate kinase [Pseudobutyrivibrio sp.]MBP5325975.1 guanylate kinase [Pseudobutyrivibrio sp.]MBP5595357.1 guanylate kinase [Pseudobutyrivibrio sp.]MBQ7469074.1 guanylate kinase [Pseudobutyrivibrio sp.]MBR5649901.1 guanylate kinase [Pseudobutyrivibrio sp.]
MHDKGLVVVLSGFSGAGKGTIMKHLLEAHPQDYNLSISATTRGMRAGEKEGREYFFKTKEEFEEMIEKGELLEYATFNGNSYGTPRAYVEQLIDRRKDVILEIDTHGALQVKKMYPDALLLFTMPPSAEELKNRLVGRGTETEDVIAQRLAISNSEAEIMDSYDYLIINDTLEKAVDQVHNIIQAEHFKVSRNTLTINEMKEQLKVFERSN